MQKLTVLIAVIVFACPSIILAVPADKTIKFNDSPMGVVIFDGTVHRDAGNKCNDCHKTGMFPKMSQGTVKITMQEIYDGKLCGVCHNGKRAFDAKSSCDRCHIKQ